MGFQVTGFPSIASWGFILGAQEHSPAFYGSSLSEYLYISNKQFILCLIPAHTYILDNLWYVQLIDSLLNVTPGVFFFGFFFLLLWWFKFCFLFFHFFCGCWGPLGGVTGRPEFSPPYWYLAFFSEGFKI